MRLMAPTWRRGLAVLVITGASIFTFQTEEAAAEAYPDIWNETTCKMACTGVFTFGCQWVLEHYGVPNAEEICGFSTFACKQYCEHCERLFEGCDEGGEGGEGGEEPDEGGGDGDGPEGSCETLED